MKRKLSTVDISLVGMFVALMAIGANITSIAPFMVVGGVPITLQTFFAILAGSILGKRLGAISMCVYAFVGLVGVPVFAKFSGGFTHLFSPTFGFIVSFIFTAYVTGLIIGKNRGLHTYIIASLLGMSINYLFGTNWMYFSYKFWAEAPEGFTYSLAWLWMIVPLPKDIALAVGAAIFAHRFERTFVSRGYFASLKKTFK
ncbi:biotin transporter BioY [Lederbergia graminis]|uniref:Biotin transporter n=1 Tax=Lederbergia graminis TaxID=735518 RepID=A0ABW0LJF6_9BACI